MSKPKVFEKPTGVQDYLPDVVAKLRAIETRVLECMSRWGYQEIMTPTLEFYDTVGIASSTSDNKLFKLLDRNGATLVMRSDMTAPIARVVSSLLKDRPFPLRLSYHGAVFRATPAEAGRDMEFFQTGLELVGDASAEADAEVVALAVAALQAAGVSRFKIAIGHVGFLNGLLQAALPGRPEDQQELKERLLNRDFVGYRDSLRKLALPQGVEEELAGILRLRGGEEICSQALQLKLDQGAAESIGHLCEVWNILKDYGVCEQVLIDLTMIGDFDYYTGMIFEGYAAELGFPVCSGGRYDKLLQQFGRPAAATGFALKTNRILEVVDSEQVMELDSVLVLYSAEKRGEALRTAHLLRIEDEARVVAKRVESEREWEEAQELPGGGVSWRGEVYSRLVRLK
ncbi:ATP phosphoribosyltransferase regulatory subunit [Paenibacillus turpanensis]|uniref:ATP phosphoribosyltransferase regulatory subunit n=1 Tax=Paenibacillus turpanensis TaxID=2689078 RepID=UPI001407FC81|nr:ATP phosphoribosyltransferase regulatory subunit [Paenibacillus turpanensis]